MRPINKGKNNKKFKKYPDAKPDLTERLGNYCSYCEMRLPASLAVEHVQPKVIHPELRLEWDNFLLGCTNCNSTKGDSKIKVEEYLWPDKDNTFLAFVYNEGGRITVNSKLDEKQRKCAQSILDLVGLQKQPGVIGLKNTDYRWRDRKEQWDAATRAFERLKNNDTKALREQIVETAYGGGHWSIWMTVFKNDGDMLKRFIDKFPGTSMECFDDMGVPIPRKNGIV